MDINSEQEQDLSRPGWLKVKDGKIDEVPFNQITKSFLISTENCEQQKFEADTYGVFTRDDWISTVSQKQLEDSKNLEYEIYETGNEEVVETARKGDKVKFVLEGPELDVTLFQNSTILSKWTVVRTYRVPLHSIENSTDSTKVCVHHQAQDIQECRVLQLQRVNEKEDRPLWIAKSTTVNAIPIVWKALTNQPNNFLNSLTGHDGSIWNLDKLISQPVLIIIQSFLAIIVLILCIKIILCLIPKCKPNA